MKVKTDPVKYIGEPDIDRLEAFYFGIESYFERSEGKVCHRIVGFREFLVDGKCIDPGGAIGYAHVILYNCKDKKEAFYRFYEFLEEFLAVQGESYEPLRIKTPWEPFPVIAGGPAKVIWALVNTERTKIAVGAISLTLLESFISGVIHCAEILENKQFELLPGFDDYLRGRFQIGEGLSRYQIIQENSASDKEAFKNFYSWMHDFLETKGTAYEPVVEKQGVLN